MFYQWNGVPCRLAHFTYKIVFLVVMNEIVAPVFVSRKKVSINWAQRRVFLNTGILLGVQSDKLLKNGNAIPVEVL